MQLGSLFKVILKTFFIIKSISTPIIFVGVGKVSFFSCWQIEYTWFMDLNMEKKNHNNTPRTCMKVLRYTSSSQQKGSLD